MKTTAMKPIYISTEDTDFPREKREMNSTLAEFIKETSSPSGIWGYCKTSTGKLIPVCSTWDSGSTYTGTNWRAYRNVIKEHNLTVDEFFEWRYIEDLLNRS